MFANTFSEPFFKLILQQLGAYPFSSENRFVLFFPKMSLAPFNTQPLRWFPTKKLEENMNLIVHNIPTLKNQFTSAALSNNDIGAGA